MEMTPSQVAAYRFIMSGNNTTLLGKPGTGKTELMKRIIYDMRAKGLKVAITGTTGMAASNYARGMTLHSFLRWKPNHGHIDYDECTGLLKEVNVLLIDEISMLSTDILCHLVGCLSRVPYPPQIIQCGDFFQLPPVGQKHYPFEDRNWRYLNCATMELREVVRQSDPVFICMLDRAMWGDDTCVRYFNEESCPYRINGAILLCTRNDAVKAHNQRMYDSLSGVSRAYQALGDLNRAVFTDSKVDKVFCVKENMRVIATRNDRSGRYHNGSLGTVVDMADDSITVHYDSGTTVEMEREEYFLDTRDDSGHVAVEQFPLSLGYAITIHKSQGQTFDSVNINAPYCWDAGQLYVALSRCRDIRNMHLMQKITKESLKTDSRVIKYYKSLYDERSFCNE